MSLRFLKVVKIRVQELSALVIKYSSIVFCRLGYVTTDPYFWILIHWCFVILRWKYLWFHMELEHINTFDCMRKSAEIAGIWRYRHIKFYADPWSQRSNGLRHFWIWFPTLKIWILLRESYFRVKINEMKSSQTLKTVSSVKVELILFKIYSSWFFYSQLI